VRRRAQCDAHITKLVIGESEIRHESTYCKRTNPPRPDVTEQHKTCLNGGRPSAVVR
jgi:hypothetical protein